MALLTNDDGGVKPWVTYTTVALVVVVAGYVVWGAMNKADRPHGLTMACSTPGCDFGDRMAPDPDAELPLKCPKCKQQSVWPGVNCPACKEPNVMGDDGKVKCRKCGREFGRGS
jgi:hypothetical protein